MNGVAESTDEIEFETLVDGISWYSESGKRSDMYFKKRSSFERCKTMGVTVREL